MTRERTGARASQRQLTATKKALGQCVACSLAQGTPAHAGHTLCEAHLEAARVREKGQVRTERDRATRKAARLLKRALGLCAWGRMPCPSEAEPGKSLCPAHAEMNRTMIREARAKAKAQGKCWRCPLPARPGGVLCEAHRREVSEAEALKEQARKTPPRRENEAA